MNVFAQCECHGLRLKSIFFGGFLAAATVLPASAALADSAKHEERYYESSSHRPWWRDADEPRTKHPFRGQRRASARRHDMKRPLRKDFTAVRTARKEVQDDR